MSNYQVHLQLNSQQNIYESFDADDDDTAIEIGTQRANNYITSGKQPRLVTAYVSVKVLSQTARNAWGQYTGYYWSTIRHLMRGRDIWQTDVETCRFCNGKGTTHEESRWQKAK